MPVTEIGFSPVIDKMSAPDRLHFPNDTGINQLFHFDHGWIMAHIMPDIQFRSGFHCGTKNTVAAFDGDRHRFFQINRFSRFQSIDCHFFMEKIRCRNKNSINIITIDHLMIIGINIGFGEFLLKFFQTVRVGIRSGNNAHTFFRVMCLPGMDTASDHTDQTNSQIFHFILLSYSLSDAQKQKMSASELKLFQFIFREFCILVPKIKIPDFITG